MQSLDASPFSARQRQLAGSKRVNAPSDTCVVIPLLRHACVTDCFYVWE
jgi:hypothetical protein